MRRLKLSWKQLEYLVSFCFATRDLFLATTKKSFYIALVQCSENGLTLHSFSVWLSSVLLSVVSVPIFFHYLFHYPPTTKTVTSLLRHTKPLLPLATIPRSRRDDLSAVAPFKDFLFFVFSNVAEPSLVWHCLASFFLAAADVISNANCGSGGAAIKKLQKKERHRWSRCRRLLKPFACNFSWNCSSPPPSPLVARFTCYRLALFKVLASFLLTTFLFFLSLPKLASHNLAPLEALPFLRHSFHCHETFCH